MWEAMRVLHYGPDSQCNWDRMERMGLYRSHLLNSTNASSHGGATVHAYGVKVPFDTYGRVNDASFVARSGQARSIMMEARDSGLGTALINSGHICEPGSGVFVASSPERSNTDLISAQIVNSGLDVILSGGEKYLLPENTVGYHGVEGVRKDGKNLIETANSLGYTVVFTRDELLNLPDTVTRVFGVFAASHTFNAKSEEELREKGLPLYNDGTPTVAEMLRVAIGVLERQNKPFFIVAEEEGTDNFSNYNHAIGSMTALKRADDAIGVALEFIERSPGTLLITAADSDAGGIQMVAIRDSTEFSQPVPLESDNGGPLDGNDGPQTLPFVAAPDRHGTRLRFAVAWATYDDVAGSVIARTHGLNAELLQNNVDNTDIYRLMYATLFGMILPRD